MAIVCEGAADFAAKCQQAAMKIADRSKLARERLAGTGVYLGEPAVAAGGAAFVFPGQGSQYPGMLARLVEELPEAKQACRVADAAMQAFGYETFGELTGEGAKDLGLDIWKTQASMLLADYIIQESLARLGLTPSIVAGHSFGEYAALVCAGGWSLTDAIRATRHRYQSIIESGERNGAMAATDAPPAEVEQLLLAGGFEGAYLANLNAPDQTVVSGRGPVVERVVVQLRQRGFSAVAIKVPCPFHTPLMASTASGFAARLAEIPLRDSAVPVVSTATYRVMLRREEFRDSLLGQLTLPVKYGEMLCTVLETRPALVVEAGPRQTLTQLNKKNHPDDDVLFVSSDVMRRPGAATLLGVVAQAECLGCLERPCQQHVLGAEKRAAGAGRVLVFDATQRRTSKMREAARTGRVTAIPAKYETRKAPAPVLEGAPGARPEPGHATVQTPARPVRAVFDQRTVLEDTRPVAPIAEHDTGECPAGDALPLEHDATLESSIAHRAHAGRCPGWRSDEVERRRAPTDSGGVCGGADRLSRRHD